jgi:hypothetical protein
MRRLEGLLIRSVAYFGLVFSVGFILGSIRVPLVVPLVGERAAELLEAPLMLVAIFFSARFVTRRFKALRRVDLLYSGLAALLVLLAVEFSVVLGLQGLTVREYLAGRDPVAGVVYVVMLMIFAAMPWLVAGYRHAEFD